MFCPNCASQNDETQHYCRACGLRLDAIAAALSTQKPSAEMAALIKRKTVTTVMGIVSLSVAGIVGLMLVLSTIFYYKLLFLGPEVLFGSAAGAIMLFLLASVFFFNYQKRVIKVERRPEQPDLATPTNKLLNDQPFEPASVPEHSTEVLLRE